MELDRNGTWTTHTLPHGFRMECERGGVLHELTVTNNMAEELVALDTAHWRVVIDEGIARRPTHVEQEGDIAPAGRGDAFIFSCPPVESDTTSMLLYDDDPNTEDGFARLLGTLEV